MDMDNLVNFLNVLGMASIRSEVQVSVMVDARNWALIPNVTNPWVELTLEN